MQLRARGSIGVGEPGGAWCNVDRTNSGDSNWFMCSRKRDLQGAGCAEDGAWVCDILQRRSESREWAREAMVAVFELFVSDVSCACGDIWNGADMKEKVTRGSERGRPVDDAYIELFLLVLGRT